MKRNSFIYFMILFFSIHCFAMVPPPPPPVGMQEDAGMVPSPPGVPEEQAQVPQPPEPIEDTVQPVAPVQDVAPTPLPEEQVPPPVAEQPPAPQDPGQGVPVVQPPTPPVQPQVPQQPPAPPVNFKQAKWPQAVEVKEDDKGLVTGRFNAELKAGVEEADKINEDIQNVLKEIYNLRQTFDKKYFQFDQELDTFLNQYGFIRGESEEVIDVLAQESIGANASQLAIAKADWNQIKSDIESIDNLEVDFLNLLKNLNMQLKNATNDAAQARIVGRDILNLSSKSQVGVKLNQLNNFLSNIKGTQNYMKTTFVTQVDSLLQKAKNKMQQVKLGVEKLKQKGVKFSDELGKLPSSEAAEIKAKVLEEKKKKQSKLFKTTVNATAFVVDGVRRLGDWISDAIRMGVAQSKKKVSSKQEAQEQKIGMQSKPNVEVPNNVQQANNVKKQQHPRWRIIADKVFDKVLDLVSFVFTKLKYYSILFYEQFLKVKTQKFVDAVQLRIKDIEKEKLKTYLKQITPPPLPKVNIAKQAPGMVPPPPPGMPPADVGMPAPPPPVVEENVGMPAPPPIPGPPAPESNVGMRVPPPPPPAE